MKIVLLAAAERGIKCLEKIGTLMSKEDELIVFSFKETAWEPPFNKKLDELTMGLGGQFFLSSKVHHEEFTDIWTQGPDLILVIGWRYLIPKSVYDSAKIGCFVFHDSYLPYYRGFGPSVWAVRNGESFTGASLFKIVDEMDAGPIVEQRKILIAEDDYISDVVANVTNTYIEIINSVFPKFKSNHYTMFEQEHEKATFTCKSLPEDFRINWSKSAVEIRNLIRAYAMPYPGSYFYLEGQKIIICEAVAFSEQCYVGLIPGRIIKMESGQGVYVGTGGGLLMIKDVILENGDRVNSTKIINRISLTLE